MRFDLMDRNLGHDVKVFDIQTPEQLEAARKLFEECIERGDVVAKRAKPGADAVVTRTFDPNAEAYVTSQHFTGG